MSTLLEVRNLHVEFRIGTQLGRLTGAGAPSRIAAVAGVDLDLEEGQTYALVGESGSGKSTLARAVNGLVEAEPGSSIRFDGDELVGLSHSAFQKHRRQMAMMFQDPIGSLSPRLSVRSLLTEPFKAHGLTDRDLNAECNRLLQMVGLPTAFADRYPHQLSGGQARRVGVARALAVDPKLIIADEPTAGLDVSVQGEVLNLLDEFQQRLGLTILIITHNLHVVRHVSHRTAIMYLGRFVEEGPTEDIFRDPRHPYTKSLLSAAPKPDPDAQHTRVELKGEVPSLKNRPSGCEFHPRCPFAQEDCKTVAPDYTVEPGGHRYTCLHPLA